jgi:hypothetical protein
MFLFACYCKAIENNYCQRQESKKAIMDDFK